MSVIRHFVAALCFAPAALAADVIRVPQDVGNLQAAVDLAQPGDVILAAPFAYLMPILVEGKGVTLVADGAASLTILEVRNVPTGQTFVLDGFALDVPNHVSGANTPFTAEDNAGALRIQDCTFEGDAGYAGSLPGTVSSYPGSPGAWLRNCGDVAFHGCTARGGTGADLWDEDIEWTATAGGAAIEARDCSVVLDDCTLTGGSGGTQYDTVSSPGGSGGDGIFAPGDSFVAMVGCTVYGGHGGSADCTFFSCGNGGAGGDAIHLLSSSGEATVRAVAFTPGLGGFDGDFGKASDGELVQSGSATTTFDARARRLSLASPLREGGAATFGLTGQPGDVALLFASTSTEFVTVASAQGTFLAGAPFAVSSFLLTTLPGSGAADVVTHVPTLAPGTDALVLHVQSVFLDDGALPLIGPSRTLTLLDAGL